MSEVQMPRLSDSMEEGTVLKWLKAPGDPVHRGDDLVEIETDKATMTFQADADGLLEIIAREGDTLPIGAPIARLGDGAESASTAPGEPAPGEPASGAPGEFASGAPGESAPGESAPHASPVAAVQGTPPVVAAPGVRPAEGPTAPAAPAEAAPDDFAAAGPVETAPGATATRAPPIHAVPGTPRVAAVAPAIAAPAAQVARGASERIKVSPIARRIARERGLELSGLSGTGPGGRIVRADVEGLPTAARPPTREEPPAAAAPPTPAAPPVSASPPMMASPSAPPPTLMQPPAADTPAAGAKGQVTVQEPTRAQQVVARRMSASRATIPEFTLAAEVDMTRCVELRGRLRAIHGGRPAPSYNDIVVKACGLALREHPRANAAWRDGRFELYSRVNIGVAVAGEGVLVVPTVFDADQRPLDEIAAETRRLAQRVRAAEITPPELAGATFTVSNLGMFGVKSFTAVINPPQAAILAVGAVTARPIVRDGAVAAGHAMDVTLACDHRILYGADAARFLDRVRELLEEPLALLR